MVDMASLLNTEIHLVQDPWPGKKELCAANHTAISSAKEICYFQVVPPKESPKIMGLKGIHFPEALRYHGSLSFCPWWGKEGQNEGTVVNHLHTNHYHLGLICERCLLYFTTNSNVMQCHTQGYEPTHPNDDSSDNEELGVRKVGMGTNTCDTITAQKHPIQTFTKEVLAFTFLHNKSVS